MGLQVVLLVAAIASSLLPARSCIVCLAGVQMALESLELEYLPTHVAPELREEVFDSIKRRMENFKDLSDLGPNYKELVDMNIVARSALRFLRSTKEIINRGLSGDTFEKEFSKMLTQVKAAFRRKVSQFLREGICPNKCGMLARAMLQCRTCRLEIHKCYVSTDCGVLKINVHEKDEMILDCELDWHPAAYGKLEYSFYRVQGRKSETLLSKGERPILSQPQVRKEDAGNYRCELDTTSDKPASVVHFVVSVLPPGIIGNITTTRSTTFVTETPAIETEAEEEFWEDLYPTLEPVECSKPQSLQRGRLIGLLIWCFLLLIIGFVLGVLCFRSGSVIGSIKLFRTDKAAAPQDQVPQMQQSQRQLSQGQLSQNQVLPNQPS